MLGGLLRLETVHGTVMLHAALGGSSGDQQHGSEVISQLILIHGECP
jgi:hypothetical protein